MLFQGAYVRKKPSSLVTFPERNGAMLTEQQVKAAVVLELWPLLRRRLAQGQHGCLSNICGKPNRVA